VFGVEVHPDRLAEDPPHDEKLVRPVLQTTRFLHPAVLEALAARLKIETVTKKHNVRLVRRSLDARSHQRRADGGTGPRFVYVLDVDVDVDASNIRWKHQPGRMELMKEPPEESTKEESHDRRQDEASTAPKESKKKPRVVIVGAGPAGLFCALQLAKTGLVTPIVLERGQPVETRGKDIGALIHRRSLDSESNFAFGEGGAGTWSDGKLTTRIGRNSRSVRQVLETLVRYGAPEQILIEGAPHLGTDNLVRLLRNMRSDLRRLGGEIRFGTKVTGLCVTKDGVATGVDYLVSRAVVERNMPHHDIGSDDESKLDVDATGTILCDAVVLATGHSARDIYEQLHKSGVKLEAKGFAVGFRVEHPQKLINKIQYGAGWASSVVTGRKTTDAANQEYLSSLDKESHHKGHLPVPSYRLATDKAFDGVEFRGAYSFCMCPGGQIVPASTDPEEVCVNGMSFSRRDSQWANSALVVTVSPEDSVLEPYREEHGVLAGVAFQRDMERRASIMGGGNMTVPVQRLTDFIAGRPSKTAPSSSYRLGVKPAPCHEIYPSPLVAALRNALTEHFERQLPGFVCEDGLLHAVETRTSSPLRVVREKETMEAIGCRKLFPAGEGGGWAGGIVSAAVDGMAVAESVLLGVLDGECNVRREKVENGIGTFY